MEAQLLLDNKTNGISTYCMEVLHYGYQVCLNKLVETNKEQGAKILQQFMDQYKHTHKGDNVPITIEKLTYIFDKDLYGKRFGAIQNPFCLEQKINGKLNNLHKLYY